MVQTNQGPEKGAEHADYRLWLSPGLPTNCVCGYRNGRVPWSSSNGWPASSFTSVQSWYCRIYRGAALIPPEIPVPQLCPIIVCGMCARSRHALVCSTDGSDHKYELSFGSPRLRGRSQEQLHSAIRPGVSLQRRCEPCTIELKSHSSHRIRRKR